MIVSWISHSRRSAYDRQSNDAIGAAIEVHRIMGPGLLESMYQECLAHELTLRSISFACEVQTPLFYKGHQLKSTYRADMIVDDRLLVEVKSVEEFAPIHQSQLLTYLKLTNLQVGLLLNFQ